MSSQTEFPEIGAYSPKAMGRPLTKQRPKQGARLAALRRAAGFSQAQLAKAVGETQQNIAFWELSSKPPRSDVLPKLAKVLGVRIEELLGEVPITSAKRPGPVGKLQRVFEQASALPRSKQELVIQFVNTLVDQQKKAS